MYDQWGYPAPVATDTVDESCDFDITVFIQCDYCGELLELESEGVYLLVGKVGRGAKSGRAMVVPCQERGAEANLHVDCIRPWLGLDEVEEITEDELKFCAACESKLDGDE